MTERESYPAVLNELWPFLLDDMRKLGFTQFDAERIALTATERIRKQWGGIQIYIPMGRMLKLSRRDVEICQRFNGHNKLELCREFKITAPHLYRIVNQVHASKRKRGSSPGGNDRSEGRKQS